MKKTPTHDQAHGAFENHISNDLDYPTGKRLRKAESTLLARLALAGHSVYPLREGGYLVSKWNYTFHAGDADELQAFAVRLGVRHD